ncbi:MAG: hypothetical protein ACLP59_27810 [Bryobacteraceae bacterium]
MRRSSSTSPACSRGHLAEPRPSHYIAAAGSREYAVGRMQMHRDGLPFELSTNICSLNS